MDDDYKRFCLKCPWNDSDLGCTSPSGEEVWQCPLYIHYHPEEVKEFEQSMEEWAKQKAESEDKEMIYDEIKQLPSIVDSFLDVAILNEVRQHLNEKLDEVCKLAINALDQRWIPVSEKLPEFTADYKVTVGINYDGGGMFPEVRIALYNKVYKCWVVYESDRAIVGDVIAWMPLPEPYKEDEADDE